MMKKRLKISKKIYVSPLVEFEEIEQDELDMLMISNNSTTGSDNPGQGSQGFSMDISFDLENASQEDSELHNSSDFLINDF